MVSIALIVLIAAAVLCVIAAAFYIFRPKGRKVFLEFYELKGGTPRLLNPKKRIFGRVFRKDGREKLKIPGRYSKFPLQAPTDECYINCKGDFDLLRLLKVSEELYVPLQYHVMEKSKGYIDAINEQSEPISWMLTENEGLAERHKKQDFWSKYATIITVAVVGIVALLIIYGTGQQINDLTDGYRQEVLGEIKNERNFLTEVVNNINGKNNNDDEVAKDTDAPPPPR